MSKSLISIILFKISVDNQEIFHFMHNLSFTLNDFFIKYI